ncbi:MAG: hypothetical protein ACXWB9_05765, partial [Flavisolibacter sp.]
SSIEFNGESKIMIQSIHASIRNDNKMELLSNYLKNGNGNVEVSNIKNSDFSDRQKPLKLDFEFKVANQVTRAGNEVYVIMDWDKDFSGYEIPGERKNDYEFNQKYYYSTHTELAIPAGHKVDYLPAPFKKSTADFSFEGSYSNNGKSIIYKKTIVVNKPILKKSGFSEWNAFIADINKFYNDQVVLVK